MLKAIFFDMDGLLFDSERVYCSFWKKSAEDCGYRLPDQIVLQLRSCMPSLGREIVDSYLHADGAYDAIRAKRKAMTKDYFSRQIPPVKKGVPEFLQKLEGIPQVRKLIVTQSDRNEKMHLLEGSGLLPYFDDIVSGVDVKRGKPYPDIYLYACEKTGQKPEDCLAYEDSPNGIRSAHSAGVKVIMIPDLSLPDQECRNLCEGVYDRIDQSYGYVCSAVSEF